MEPIRTEYIHEKSTLTYRSTRYPYKSWEVQCAELATTTEVQYYFKAKIPEDDSCLIPSIMFKGKL